MSKTEKNSRASGKTTLMLVQLGLLTAIIFLFELTGIGYIQLTALSVTIMMIPVAIGAITMGKTAGAVLGLMFGVTSMMQCFGKNPLGVLILSINPFYTVVLNVGVRVLVGFLTAVIFRALIRVDKTRVWSFAASALAASLMNTALYLTTLVVLFGGEPQVQEALGGAGGMVLLGALFATSAVSAIAEAAVCMAVGGTVAMALARQLKIKD